MKREVDPKRTRKALRAIEKLKARAAEEIVDPETGEVKPPADYSEWEKEFLGEVEQRLEKYGSAFHNLSKGRAEEALSSLQSVKLKEIAAKAKGPKKPMKPRKTLQAKKGFGARKPARTRQLDED